MNCLYAVVSPRCFKYRNCILRASVLVFAVFLCDQFLEKKKKSDKNCCIFLFLFSSCLLVDDNDL
uniref:Uncharacterized protein n=1 Tax=Rhizophora mucronata TaxID=61149 RepID=A0A2P2PFB5_RHIMU